MGTYGQDWASYQSPTPATAGLGFAFVKVTEGLGYTNPYWQTQVAHARANGLVVGLYHYPHMGNSVQAEADHFLAVIGPHLLSGDLIVLDWEGYDTANQGVPKSAQAAYKDAWLKYVQAKLPTHQVGCYCNTDYWVNVDKTSFRGDFLWIATAGRAAGDPGIKAPWVFHQFSDTPLDRDYTALSLDALKAFAHAKEANVPLPDTDINKIASATAALLTDGTHRDALAGADIYWLRRAFDPSIPLNAKGAPFVVQEVLGLRAVLVAREAALTAAIEALTKAVGAGGITAAQITEAAQVGADAALAKLGLSLEAQAPKTGTPAPADTTWAATPVTQSAPVAPATATPAEPVAAPAAAPVADATPAK